MDKDKFEKLIGELEFERNKWLDFSEIDTILLKMEEEYILIGVICDS